MCAKSRRWITVCWLSWEVCWVGLGSTWLNDEDAKDESGIWKPWLGGGDGCWCRPTEVVRPEALCRDGWAAETKSPVRDAIEASFASSTGVAPLATGGDEDGGGEGNLEEAPSAGAVPSVGAAAAADFRALCCVVGDRVAAAVELRLSEAVCSMSSRRWDRGVETDARGRLEERRGGES